MLILCYGHHDVTKFNFVYQQLLIVKQ